MPESDLADVDWNIPLIDFAKAFPSSSLTCDFWYKSFLFATTANIGSPLAFNFVCFSYQ